MKGFIASRPELRGSKAALFGAPYDGTASFRPGTRFGPTAIRQVSDGLETYSPALDRDLEDLAFADLGDLELGFGAPGPQIQAVEQMTRAILEAQALPFMLGGEHSLTGGAVKAILERYGEVTILQIDAHADLRSEYLNEPLSHACVMRRCVEMGATLCQFGIRSGPREEWAWMRAQGTLHKLQDFPTVLGQLKGPVYLTLDIDAFDPSLVPGTGTPEPGGLFWADFEHMILALASCRPHLVGIDLMELSPNLDPSGVSSVVAAKCVRELLLVL